MITTVSDFFAVKITTYIYGISQESIKIALLFKSSSLYTIYINLKLHTDILHFTIILKMMANEFAHSKNSLARVKIQNPASTPKDN